MQLAEVIFIIWKAPPKVNCDDCIVSSFSKKTPIWPLDVADIFVYSPKLGKNWRENMELLLIPRLFKSPHYSKLFYIWFIDGFIWLVKSRMFLFLIPKCIRGIIQKNVQSCVATGSTESPLFACLFFLGNSERTRLSSVTDQGQRHQWMEYRFTYFIIWGSRNGGGGVVRWEWGCCLTPSVPLLRPLTAIELITIQLVTIQ